MKGRWRADKRKPGCGISCAQPSSRCALQDEKTPQADIFKGFTFSKSESSTTRTDALQGAHSALVRSQFIMSDGISHDDFMVCVCGLFWTARRLRCDLGGVEDRLPLT